MDAEYVSNVNGGTVSAVLLDARQSFIDFDGNRTWAEAGEYLITAPYMDHVDQESFEREYELIGSDDNE